MDMKEIEMQLTSYLRHILTCQIVPMEFMDLRDLVKDAPKKKYYKFIQKNYPGEQFLDFLRKFPNFFTINPDLTVVMTDGNNYYMRPCANANTMSTRSFDEVDGRDNEEYISNSESDRESEDSKSDEEEEYHSTVSASESDSEDSSKEDGDCSSSMPDSSVRDNVLTSDSDASSLSSKSSVNEHKAQ